MDRMEKGLQILMWGVVALMVIVFFVSIMAGYATDFKFFFSSQDVTELNQAVASIGNGLL